MTEASLLDKTLAHVRGALGRGEPAVVVLDLDGTVFDNGPRTWQILADFFEQESMGAERRQLSALPHVGLPYTHGDILAKARIDVDDATQKAILAFWKKRFFSQEYQRFDVPLPGAVAFVRRLYDEGATVCYLTGRDDPGMGVGCLSSLHSFGFPASLMRTAMVLKPDFETPDLDFKRDALGFIDQLGTVVASFDNEPGNCNLFAERWPQALVGLADTSHAPGAPPLDAGVIRFDDFLS